ncbi:molecular chaperone DnaK [Candidatus Kaiserbacteria bacterium]|nr:MAG: molecular chaperone DnaK [Candidatus Kaiserbacteria bacterium]
MNGGTFNPPFGNTNVFKEKVAVSFDIGTSYCVSAVFRNGHVEIVSNDHGNRTTPSWVAFSENERFIGDAAKAQASRNPKNTIYDAKRLIGCKFSDAKIQNDISYWPFKVDSNEYGNPVICVEYRKEERRFLPEEISSMLIRKLKSDVESYLGEQISEAVITVPAYFNDSQRQATVDAANIAGLQVLRIINEPTAASLAYGIGNDKANKGQNVLIVDIGGGTSDFTVLRIDEGVFHVKATGGDTHLGGQDFDNLMAELFITQFRRKYKINLKSRPKALKRLLFECDKAKRVLSVSTQATIDLDSLCEGIDFVSTISRARFEEICRPHFKKCIKYIETVLIDAKMGPNDIDEIVLVGGSTRIPKLQNDISQYFNGKKLNKSINPDEAIAYGAAIQAAILSNIEHSSIDDILLIDVAPLTIGIEVHGGLMSPVISRNTTIPAKCEEQYTTFADDQEVVTISVFEGERQFVRDNRLLGEFHLTGIPKLPRGAPRIQISFEINEDGILNIVAWNKDGDVKEKLVIKNEKGHLSNEEIENLIKEAQENEKVDAVEKNRIETRTELENYLYRVSTSCSENVEWQEYLDTIYEWFESFGNSATIEELEDKLEEVEETLNGVSNKPKDNFDDFVEGGTKLDGIDLDEIDFADEAV